jgi:hypothetical protein
MLREFICGDDDVTEDLNPQSSVQAEKHSVKGFISNDATVKELDFTINWDDLFNSSENKMAVVPVTLETYSELSDLNCFISGGRAERDAVGFVKSYPERMQLYITLISKDELSEGGKTVDGEEFEVRVHSVASTGELTNEMVQDFATQFRFSIHSEFDPLAEDHERPHLEVFVPRRMC